jgi:large subunit ribosomal protein L33
VAERFLGKEEVGSSILLPGSTLGRPDRLPARAWRGYRAAQGGSMADFVQLQCTECERINYSTFRNKKTKQDKLVKKKYCPWDRKHTEHKEVKA